MNIFSEKYVDVEDECCGTCGGTCGGIETIVNVDPRTIERLHGGCLAISVSDVSDTWEALENSFAILQNGSTSVLATVQDGTIIHVRPGTAYGIQGKNVEQIFAIDALLNPNIPLVTVTGVAGTGKTLLALAAAIENRKYFRQILMARPVMPMGKDIGYLPGSMEDKMGPYMAPLKDNIAVIKEQFKDGDRAARVITEMIEREKLVVEHLTYIRGRSLSRSFLIVDEAQNLTPHEVKTIVTRAGEGTKIVLTGDVDQIDNQKLNSYNNGLADLTRKFKDQKLYAHIHLTKSERSPLAKLAGELL